MSRRLDSTLPAAPKCSATLFSRIERVGNQVYKGARDARARGLSDLGTVNRSAEKLTWLAMSYAHSGRCDEARDVARRAIKALRKSR